MAIPGIPQNLVIQAGNGQILLDWSLQSGAISYTIQRSIDNVAYAFLATTTINQYVDTSVVVGTQYFYKIASVNASGTSGFTGVASAIPVLTGDETLQSLRVQSQRKADMENSSFITKAEWNDYINKSAFELYDLLVTLFEDMYVADPYQVDLGTTDTITIPNDCYKVLGVDVSYSGTNYMTLKRFNFIDRNRYSLPQATAALARGTNLQYRLLGNSIKLIPMPSQGQKFQLWYVPKMKTLLLDTDIITGVSGWTEYITTDAAIKAMLKEESDASALMAQKAALIKRINDSASNRDAGQPQTISDTRDVNYYDPVGWGDY